MSAVEEKWEPLDWTSKKYAKVLLFRWIFFLNVFLITSELQTERVTKDEWVHTICSSGDESPLGGTRGSAAFLQTLNKYVSYCFDVGSAAVLRDQDWNAMAKEESFEQVVIEGITVRTPSIW